MDAIWTRIWCVRPVLSRHSSRVKFAQPFQHLIARIGILGSRFSYGVDRHLFTVSMRAGDAAFHHPLLLRKAPIDHGMIRPLYAMDRHLLGQANMGRIVFGYHQQTAGILIDAVNDARTDQPANTGKAALAMPQQGVDQCTIRIAWGGVDHHPLGLFTTSRCSSS